MQKNTKLARGAGTVCAIAGALSVAAAGNALAAEEAGLEAIVVTAQRRAEPIEKVPQAVQAISGTDLTREGVTNLAQTIALIPSATAGATIGPGMSTFQIRGVTTGETDGDPTVGYYLDNFAFSMPGRPYAPVADFYDMQRVEVLRGPSGTLYGLGSLGGTIKVITNDPVLNKYEASVRLTGGQTANANGNYSGDLMFNLPLMTDRVSLRGVVSYRHTSGYAYIIPSNQPNGNPVDDWTGRMKLLAKVTDDLSVTLGYWHNTTHPKYSDRITYPDNPQYGGPAVDQTFGEAPSKYDIGTLDVSYDMGFATLQSTTGYLHNSVISNNGGFIPGIGRFTSFWPLDAKNFNEDLRLVSSGAGALRYIAGFFYQDGNTAGGQSVSLPDFPAFGPGTTGFGTLNDNRLDSKSWAIYGEGTYTTLNGLLDLTLGGRFYEEKRKFTQNSANVIYAPTGDTTLPTVGVDEAKHNTFNPRVNIALHPADNGMVFVEAAKGFRSGAITSGAIIAGANAVLGTHLNNSSPPDTLWNYELGTKWTFLDKAVSVELIGYIFDWKDAQLELSPTLQSIVVPAGSVRGKGVDLSIDWRVFNTGLELRASGNLNSTLLHDVPTEISAGLPQISNNAQLPGTAKASGSFVAAYVHEIGRGYELRLNGRYSARAKQQSIFTGGAYAPYVGLTSVRAGVGNEKMELALFADNLSNARGPLDRPGGQFQIPYPRVIGLSFEIKL